MQIFYGIVVLLSCIICTLPPGHVAQEDNTHTTTIRQDCTRVENCNGTETDVHVCATNGQSCKLFPSECKLHRENCNSRTLATAWNRTASIQCTNIPSNATGLCACSPQSLALDCSNQTVTTGICAHGGHLCHLYRTECDLRRARCNGEDWQTIDSRQCRGFIFNQTNPCMCPNLLQCSRNGTQHCVQVSSSGCSLYASECAAERLRCDGESLRDVDIRQCRNMQVGQSGDCHCPALLHCQRNNTNICVRNAEGKCQLMENECDLEQQKCDGSNLTIISPLHCQNFRVNFTGNCSCPNLLNCSRNSSAICVHRQDRQGHQCQLFRNNCELEQANCEGQNLTIISPLHCHNFTENSARNCSCPGLLHCQRNSSAICVRGQNHQCLLLRNNCELEQAKCDGLDLTIISPLHCHNGTENSPRNCSCPNLLNCQRNSSEICVRLQDHQCQLLRNNCEMEQAKCEGQNFTIISPLHCHNFTENSAGNCFCPNLLSCQRNSSEICVRQQNHQCLLLRDNCELEQAKCEGRNVTVAIPQQCHNFTLNTTKSCACPNLFNCRSNLSSICVRRQNGQCALLRNNCDWEQAKCEGQNITVIPDVQCKLLTTGQNGSCWCPNLLNCQRNTSPVCTKSKDGCQLIKSKCELEEMKCNGEHANITNMIQCQSFRIGQVRACTCPRLINCSRNMTTNVCVRGQRGCLRMADACEMEIAKCRGESWSLQDAVQCHNFAIGYMGRCTCPRLNNCSRGINRNSCYQNGSQCKNVRNQCEVERLRCLGEGFTAAPQSRCRGIRRGATAACRCPELRRCNRTRTVCATNGLLFKLFRNDCELLRAVCQGEKWRISARQACCQLRINEARNCSLRVESAAVCGRTSNGMCRLFTAPCELNATNARSRTRYSITHRNECKCVGAGRTGRCSQQPTCRVPKGRASEICGRFRSALMWFNSRCELRHHNYETCTNFQVEQARHCARIRN